MASNNLQVARIPPAYKGQDSDASPEYVDTGRAPVVQNFVPGRDGKLVLRGPLLAFTGSVATATDVYPRGIWHKDDTLLVGFDTSAWKQGNPTTPNGVQVTADSTLSPGLSYTRMGDYVFGIPRDGLATDRNMLMWDGSVITKLTKAPYRAAAVKTYLNRLFVLDGTPPGGATDVGSAIRGLFWSDALDNGPVADTLDLWKDDTSGLVNQIRFDDRGNDGVAMALISGSQSLALLRKRSVWMLYGREPESFTLRQASTVKGCLHTRSVVEYGDGCFYMSEDGYVFFDGASTTVVSGPIQHKLLPTAFRSLNMIATKLRGDFILLVCSSGNFISDYSQYCVLFHIPTGSWMELTSHPSVFGTTQLPMWCGSTDRLSWVYASKYFWDVTSIGLPEMYNGVGYDLYAPNVYVGDPLVYRAVPARFWTRIMRLASPMDMTQLHRVLVDYAWQESGLAPAASGGTAKLWVSAVTGDGTVLLPATELPRLASAATAQRQRASIQEFSEATEVQLRFEYGVDYMDGVSLKTAELYDATVAYQPSRQR